MTTKQAEELRSKKRSKETQTDGEKWAWIYRVLFGRNLSLDCIPSPCRCLAFLQPCPFPAKKKASSALCQNTRLTSTYRLQYRTRRHRMLSNIALSDAKLACVQSPARSEAQV